MITHPGRLATLLCLLVCGLLFAFASPGSAQEAGVPSYSLPWEGGAVWRYAHGPHSGSGPVLDALDFQPPDAMGKQCETFTSAFWAVAAADGRATVLPNAVEVDHGNGFRTGYFHLADKQVKTGDEVKAGQRLGRPGCCPDGGAPTDCWSTDPHLHFYTIAGGARRPIVGVNIGGWLVDTDGCLVKPTRRACPGASLISNAPRPDSAAPVTPLDMTVAFDVSGSMAGAATSGELLRLLSPYLEASANGEQVTLIAFNSHARVASAPAQRRTIEELTAAVQREKPEGDTDLAGGLAVACREMQLRGPEVRKALVLVTDGFHNAAGRLQSPERCFAERGWPVFAYGVGRTNTPVLERIVGATGGEFRPSQTVFDPACELQRLRALLSGTARPACTRFLLRGGERLVVPVEVPPEQVQAALAVTWVPVGKSDGQLSIRTTLKMPSGKILDEGGALSHEVLPGAERYAIASPGKGKWEAIISGSGIPDGGVLIDFSFGTTPTAFSTGYLPTETPVPTPDAAEAREAPEISPTPYTTPRGTETPTPSTTPRRTPTPAPSPRETPRR